MSMAAYGLHCSCQAGDGSVGPWTVKSGRNGNTARPSITYIILRSLQYISLRDIERFVIKNGLQRLAFGHGGRTTG